MEKKIISAFLTVLMVLGMFQAFTVNTQAAVKFKVSASQMKKDLRGQCHSVKQYLSQFTQFNFVSAIFYGIILSELERIYMGNLIKYTSILVVMSIIMGGCASNTTNKQRSKKNTEFVLSNLKYEKKEDGKTIEYEHEDISYDFKNKIIYAPRFNNYACIDTQLPAYYGLHEPRTNDAPRLDFNYLTKKSTKFMKNFDYIINYSGLYKLNKNNEEINFTRYFLSKESNSQVFKFNKKGLLVNTKQDRYGDYKWNTTFSYKNNLLAEVNYSKSDDKDMYTIKYKYNDNNQIISYDEFLNKSKKRSAIYTYENSVLKQIEGNDFDNKDYKIILEYDNNGCLKKEKIIEDTYTYYYEYSYDTITNLKNKHEDLSYEVERYHLDEKDEKEKEIEKNSDDKNEKFENNSSSTDSSTSDDTSESENGSTKTSDLSSDELAEKAMSAVKSQIDSEFGSIEYDADGATYTITNITRNETSDGETFNIEGTYTVRYSSDNTIAETGDFTVDIDENGNATASLSGS